MDGSGDQTAESVVLVRRAQEGDHAALGRLFARYYERVQRIVRMRMGDHLRRIVDSQDILQETFVAAVRDFEKFEVREEARFIDWLAKIAQNRIRVAARHAHAAKRDRRLEDTLHRMHKEISGSGLVVEPVAPITLPGDKVAKFEEMQMLDVCIAALKPDYREVIILRDYEGASWELVAEIMRRPSANAARMLHARAVVELTAEMRKHRG